MQTITLDNGTHHGGQFQPGTFLLQFRAMGGSVNAINGKPALYYPEEHRETLVALRESLTPEESQRLRAFLHAHFGGEA